MRFQSAGARRWLAVAYLLVVVVATWQRGVVSREHTTFAIFRQSFVHLVAHQDLYAIYGDEQGPASQDLFKYSPSAAVLFAPLSVLPYAVSLFAWNLLNAALLFWAVTRLLPRRQANLALLLLLPEVFTTIQASSSNGLIAALMLLALMWIVQGKDARAAFAIAVGAMIKIFPLALASVIVTRACRRRFALTLLLAICVLLALPLLVVPAGELARQYKSWHAVQMHDAGDIQFGMSLIRAIREHWETELPSWAFQVAGTLLVLAPLIRRDRWSDERFRLQFGCSLLVFTVLFNHQAERQSLVIAAVGSAVWLVTRPVSWPLAACYALALTGATVVPYAVLWLAIQADLMGDAPRRLTGALRASWARFNGRSRVIACRSCRVLVPQGSLMCPDCRAFALVRLPVPLTRLVVRLALLAAFAHALTPEHHLFNLDSPGPVAVGSLD